MLSKGNKIIAPAAGIALLCFFLPWVTVSCAGQPIRSINGPQLANYGEAPELYLVLLAAIGCLVVALLASQGMITIRTGAYTAIGLAAASLILILAKLLDFQSQLRNISDLANLPAAWADLPIGDLTGMTPDVINVKLQYGLWGVILANVAIIVGAALDLLEASPQPPPLPTPVPTKESPPSRTVPPPRPAPRVGPTRPLREAPPVTAWFVMRSGPRAGKQFGLSTGRNIIGRDASRCDLILDDASVSAQHAQVRYERGQFVIYDLASTNGTFVNNRRIQRQPLMDNDVVRLGNTTLVFKLVGAK